MNTEQFTASLGTLYLRFDIEKLSGAYGADSYRILFTSVPPEMLLSAILRMGDSASTLSGNENVNVIGITKDIGQLNRIQQQLSASSSFMEAANAQPFSIVEGMGQEPLVIDGVFTAAGVQVQNDGFSWAKNVWDGLIKEGKVTCPTAPPESMTPENTSLFSVEYGQIQEIPFPADAEPVKFLGANHFVVTNGKTFGKKYGVVNADGKTVLPVTQKYSETINGPIKYEMLSEKAISFENSGFTLYDLNGGQIATFKKLISLGSELLAISNGKKYAVAKLDGSKITEEEFDNVLPFADGIALAQNGKTVVGFSTDATVAFTLTDIDEIRNYCNGYAMLRKGGKWGAIDTKGNMALEAKWTWLRDCAFDAFVFSEAVAPKVNTDLFGLVTVGDNITVPCRYKNLEQAGSEWLKYGTVVYYQYTQGNTRYTKSLLAFGLMDVKGNEIVPEGTAAIGQESEGLRAYSRYISESNIEFGYMNSDWKSVFVVSRIGKTSTSDAFKFGITEAKSFIFGYDIDDLLSPFSEGKAFVKLSQDGHFAKDGRWIDKTGKETSAGKMPVLKDKSTPDTTEISPNEKKAKEIIENLSRQYTCQGAEIPNKRCQQLSGDFWETESQDGHVSFVISKLESESGFSCGLLAIKDISSHKWGYADHDGKIAVSPKYDEAKPFHNNHTWVRQGKKYSILKREVQIKENAESPK